MTMHCIVGVRDNPICMELFHNWIAAAARDYEANVLLSNAYVYVHNNARSLVFSQEKLLEIYAIGAINTHGIHLIVDSQRDDLYLLFACTFTVTCFQTAL